MSSPTAAPPLAPGRRLGPPTLALTGVTKSYGDVHAVRDLDLDIAPGEIVALLGPNGAGKSTTNEMILGLVAAEAGRVEVFGADPLATVREGRVGAMLQNGALLSDARVLDLVRLMHGLHAHPLPLPEVIDRAGVADFLPTRARRRRRRRHQRAGRGLGVLVRGDRPQPPVRRDGQTGSRSRVEAVRIATDHGWLARTRPRQVRRWSGPT